MFVDTFSLYPLSKRYQGNGGAKTHPPFNQRMILTIFCFLSLFPLLLFFFAQTIKQKKQYNQHQLSHPLTLYISPPLGLVV